MRRAIPVILVAVLLMGLRVVVHARDTDRQMSHPARAWSGDRFGELLEPDLDNLFTSAQVDTHYLVCYDFEFQNWQGWTRTDNTAQADTFFHVDDFSDLDGGDFGRLIPIDGSKSWWCGARPDQSSPYLCSWIYPPGYGNNWEQSIVSDKIFTMGDTLILSYHCVFDTEPDYDSVFVQYDAGYGDWRTLAAYNGIGNAVAEHRFVPDLVATKLRFRFRSDSGWSDQDDLYNSDGAAIIDSITIAKPFRSIDFENCESDAVGSLASNGDGNHRDIYTERCGSDSASCSCAIWSCRLRSSAITS